jgi:hypothetical protein
VIWHVALHVDELDPKDGIEANLRRSVARALAAMDVFEGPPPGVPAWCFRKLGDPAFQWSSPGRVWSGSLASIESGVLSLALGSVGGSFVRVRTTAYNKAFESDMEFCAWLPGDSAAEALRTFVAASVMDA